MLNLPNANCRHLRDDRFIHASTSCVLQRARRNAIPIPESAVTANGVGAKLVKEIELKLDLSPQAASMLLNCEPLAAASVVKQQRAIYFDTPDKDLHAAGLSFRIRKSGGQRVQTIKANDGAAAGLFVRSEWNRRVRTDRPILDDRIPIRAILAKKIDRLSPVFEIHTERRIWIISQDTAEIELVLDQGDVVAGGRHTSICEIELELKAGAPKKLFSLARRLDVIAPVRLGVLSKAERGYRLLGPAYRAIKAETPALTSDMTAALAFQQIAKTCIRHFRLNETSLLEQRDSEVLHQARVALRRLRTTLSIHRAMIVDSQFDRIRNELRTLTSKLGEARNIDVLIDRSEPGKLRSRLDKARDHSYDDVATALASPHVRSLMFDLAEWIAVGDWLKDPAGRGIGDQPVREFAVFSLDRYYRKVKKRGRDIAKLDDRARHQVRKDAKNLRYAAEFFSSLFGEKQQRRRFNRFVEALELLQECLGELNDLATTSEVLAQIRPNADLGAESFLSTRTSKEKLIDAASNAHVDLMDCKRFWR